MTTSERDDQRLDRLEEHLDRAHDYRTTPPFDPDDLYAVESLHKELHDRGDTAIRHARRSLR